MLHGTAPLSAGCLAINQGGDGGAVCRWASAGVKLTMREIRQQWLWRASGPASIQGRGRRTEVSFSAAAAAAAAAADDDDDDDDVLMTAGARCNDELVKRSQQRHMVLTGGRPVGHLGTLTALIAPTGALPAI